MFLPKDPYLVNLEVKLNLLERDYEKLRKEIGIEISSEKYRNAMETICLLVKQNKTVQKNIAFKMVYNNWTYKPYQELQNISNLKGIAGRKEVVDYVSNIIAALQKESKETPYYDLKANKDRKKEIESNIEELNVLFQSIQSEFDKIDETKLSSLEKQKAAVISEQTYLSSLVNEFNEFDAKNEKYLVPQQTVPQQTVPQQTVSQQTVPQQTVPQQTVPQQTVSQQTVPQQTVPQQTVPQQTVPQQTVSQQTVPQQTVPQQTVPQQTVPQQTVPPDRREQRTVFEARPKTVAAIMSIAATASTLAATCVLVPFVIGALAVTGAVALAVTIGLPILCGVIGAALIGLATYGIYKLATKPKDSMVFGGDLTQNSNNSPTATNNLSFNNP